MHDGVFWKPHTTIEWTLVCSSPQTSTWISCNVASAFSLLLISPRSLTTLQGILLHLYPTFVSAAFVTINHPLFNILSSRGCYNIVTSWFSYYLTAIPSPLFWQVLFFIAFILYGRTLGFWCPPFILSSLSLSLGNLSRSHGYRCHFYTDNSWIHLSSSLNNSLFALHGA